MANRLLIPQANNSRLAVAESGLINAGRGVRLRTRPFFRSLFRVRDGACAFLHLKQTDNMLAVQWLDRVQVHYQSHLLLCLDLRKGIFLPEHLDVLIVVLLRIFSHATVRWTDIYSSYKSRCLLSIEAIHTFIRSRSYTHQYTIT